MEREGGRERGRRKGERGEGGGGRRKEGRSKEERGREKVKERNMKLLVDMQETKQRTNPRTSETMTLVHSLL